MREKSGISNNGSKNTTETGFTFMGMAQKEIISVPMTEAHKHPC